MKRRRFSFTVAVLLLMAGAELWISRTAHADDALISTETGMTWVYVIADEAGLVANDPRTITVRVAGRSEFEGKQFARFETLEGETLLKTELFDVSERGIICAARANRNEPLQKLDPPETLVAAPLKVGGTWETDGVVADVKLHQRFEVAAEEDVYVPAGKFRAFRLHSDETALMAIALDRWFSPGVGIVKEQTTVRGPGGALLQRMSMELQRRPEVRRLPTPTPTVAPPPPAASASPSVEITPTKSPAEAIDGKRLTVEISDSPAGGMKTKFRSDVPNIYVQWHGHGLPQNAKVRVAWVAEDVGDIVEPNFIVDQTENVVPDPDASARFTLGRPEDGWAEGKYRLEVYINDKLEETLRVTID